MNKATIYLKTLIKILFLLQFALCCSGQSQDSAFIAIKSSPLETKLLQKYNFMLPHSNDTSAIQRGSKKILSELWSDGYLLAEVSCFQDKEDPPSLWVVFGKKYQWAALRPGNIPEELLTRLDYKSRFYTNKDFRYGDIASLFGSIIRHSENNGYPFASVRMDSLEIDGNTIKAAINYTSGPLITFDSLEVTGIVKTKPKYISTILGIAYGKPYDEGKIVAIKEKLATIPYLSLEGGIKVEFRRKKAKVTLILEEKKVNLLDGFIGFLPNTANDNKLLVTGEFDLQLDNLFGSGKNFMVKWQRLKPLSQYLDMAYFHPVIFGSGLNFEGSLNILKEDTTFINRLTHLGFDYRTLGNNRLGAYSELKSARLISTVQYANSTELPEFSDFNITYYGLSYKHVGNANPVIPKTGMSFGVEGAVGEKKIRKNTGIEDRLYQGVKLSSVQGRAVTEARAFIRIGKQWVLYHQLNVGKLWNERLFLNDLFRIGGLNSLRGFNENEFFASEYAVLNNEIRYYYGKGSYLFAFYDQSYQKYNLETVDFEDTPFGLGLGLSLSTNSGQVNFVYALGKSKNQALAINLSKVHFGYVANF